MRTRNIIAGLVAAASIAGAAACQPTQTDKPAPETGTSAPAKAAVPPAGKVLLNFTGKGNQATPHFTVGDPGNYKITWEYSGNTDMGTASNFIIEEGPVSDFNIPLSLPNDIAVSGRGSTEASGDAGPHYFNVQSAGTWTIKVVTAP